MLGFVRLVLAAFVLLGIVGCGGGGPEDDQFEMAPAEIRLANNVRGLLVDMERGSDPSQVGEMLVENLPNMINDPAAEANKATYDQILAAAQKLAGGDAKQIAEIKKLAETLPK